MCWWPVRPSACCASPDPNPSLNWVPDLFSAPSLTKPPCFSNLHGSLVTMCTSKVPPLGLLCNGCPIGFTMLVSVSPAEPSLDITALAFSSLTCFLTITASLAWAQDPVTFTLPGQASVKWLEFGFNWCQEARRNKKCLGRESRSGLLRVWGETSQVERRSPLGPSPKSI